jgi:hypothetical protein
MSLIFKKYLQNKNDISNPDTIENTSNTPINNKKKYLLSKILDRYLNNTEGPKLDLL